MSTSAKIKLANVDQMIKDKKAGEVSSAFFKDSTSDSFDPLGLFSEQIFGSIGDDARMVRFGYIELNTTILHPKVFEALISLKGFYKDLIMGKTYAKFDETLKDFVVSSMDDETAQTGYDFFINNIQRVEFPKTDSTTRSIKLKAILNNMDKWFVKRFIVSPAGTRDLRKDASTGRDKYDEINDIYRRLLNITSTLQGSKASGPIYDSIRYRIQMNINEVFEYIWDMFSTVYYPNSYAARSIALATRNVLSASDIASTKANPDARLAVDQALAHLKQVMPGMAPIVKYYLKAAFFNDTFSTESNQVAVIDPKTMKLIYTEVDSSVKDRHLNSNEMDHLIHGFLESESQHAPFTISTKTGYGYLAVKYEHEDKLVWARTLDHLKAVCEKAEIPYDVANVKPLTRYEAFYMASFAAAKNKHCFMTRYPAMGHLSTAIFRVQVSTTVSYTKKIVACDFAALDNITFPRWPDPNSGNIGGVTCHPCHLKNYNGDHDGDTVNVTFQLVDDSNVEGSDFLNSPRSIISPDLLPYYGISSDMAKLTIFNLSWSPDDPE